MNRACLAAVDRASEPRSSHPRSGPRTLLVGTALSVKQLYHALAVVEPAPTVVGCLLPTAAVTATSAALPCPVLGEFDDLENHLATRAAEQVLVSLPLAMGERIRAIGGVLDRLGVAWRFMPTLADQLAGRTASYLPQGWPTQAMASTAIDPAALIDRAPRPLDEASIRSCLTDKVVMITGAGGSIGSELARIVSRFDPARLLLVERSENALFEIDREIARVFPELPRAALMHDVTHRAGTLDLLREHRPAVVFHAAAHKHVPMMEDHPAHAVENNFFGTRAIADAADACGVERFVMISTDKAVNPSSVMGASKRLAELYIQHLGARSQTIYSMVRFGNVLGSACSVLPIWASQLAHGGPITVTHPDMHRYFMTIPEAAGLVLQAGALSCGFRVPGSESTATSLTRNLQLKTRNIPGAEPGTVFLLNMGDPVRIVDLAERFVRSQGFEPGVDVQIVFTGARPGEKLFEELAYTSEDMLPTPHPSIRIWRTAQPDEARIQQITTTFDRLRTRSGDASQPWHGVTREAILNALRAAVPEMVAAVAG